MSREIGVVGLGRIGRGRTGRRVRSGVGVADFDSSAAALGCAESVGAHEVVPAGDGG